MITMRSPAPKSVSRVVGKNGASKPAAPNSRPLTPVVPRATKAEAKILFSRFFQSVGPRTYSAELKELANGNHLLVLTERKPDPETGEPRQLRLFVYGEDFTAFFRMLHETAAFIRANPLSQEVRRRRADFWARKKKRGKLE
jgi:hypothetical protein